MPDNDEVNWKKNPLPAYKHFLFCTKGASCSFPGCKQMKSCAVHIRNCENASCPTPPCVAKREFEKESDCHTYLDTIFKSALWATDVCPIIAQPSTPSTSTSSSSSFSSAQASISGSQEKESPIFRVPQLPAKRPKPKEKDNS